MLRPAALDHVGIVVSDLERSIRFYQTLGLELLRKVEPGSGRAAAVLKIAEGQEINMFCNPALIESSKGQPQRVDHLCLAMASATMDELVASLHAAGLEIASGPVQRSDGTALFLHDPDGTRVELSVKR
jgi:catechol 2,3-dioxygenase-like lactoylglutathione lyase family enzyme